MKTDNLFHEYFQIAPHALFELLQITPGCAYHFTNPVVKASEKRMDGLLEPEEPGHPHYFVEVQGYEDPSIYWRMVHQIGVYHEQRPSLNGSDWRAVCLFLDAAHDPGPETLGPLHHGATPWLITGTLADLLHQTKTGSPILNVLRPLVARSENEIREQGVKWVSDIRTLTTLPPEQQNRLLDLLIKFIVQRFTNLPWKEIEQMLKLTPIEETAAGKDWIERGKQEGMRETMRSNIVDVLETRFGIVTEELQTRVESTDDLAHLRLLLRQAVTVESLADFERILDEQQS